MLGWALGWGGHRDALQFVVGTENSQVIMPQSDECSNGGKPGAERAQRKGFPHLKSSMLQTSVQWGGRGGEARHGRGSVESMGLGAED